MYCTSTHIPLTNVDGKAFGHVCLSCLCSNLSKHGAGNFISGVQVNLQNIYVKFVYQSEDDRSKKWDIRC